MLIVLISVDFVLIFVPVGKYAKKGYKPLVKNFDDIVMFLTKNKKRAPSGGKIKYELIDDLSLKDIYYDLRMSGYVPSILRAKNKVTGIRLMNKTTGEAISFRVNSSSKTKIKTISSRVGKYEHDIVLKQ